MQMNNQLREELTQCLAEYLDARHGFWELRTPQDYRELAQDVMEFTYGEETPDLEGHPDRDFDLGVCCLGTDCGCDDRPSLTGVIEPPQIRRGGVSFPVHQELTAEFFPAPSSDSGQTPQ